MKTKPPNPSYGRYYSDSTAGSVLIFFTLGRFIAIGLFTFLINYGYYNETIKPANTPNFEGI